MSDWKLSGGAERPIWEPVRIIDFDGERLRALIALRLKLNLSELPDGKTETNEEKQERYRTHLAQMTEEDLALHAILEFLFVNATVRLDAAKAEAIRLATFRLPHPGGKKRRRLHTNVREDLIMLVGRIWTIFISHNFPLNQPELMQRFKIDPPPSED